MMPYLLIKIKLFFEKIRKNKHIQIIIGILPGVFCFIFTSAFVLDTLNVFGTLSINNNYVATAQEKEMFLTVEPYNSILNIVKGNKTLTVTPDEQDGFVCNIKREGIGYSFQNDLDQAYIPLVSFVTYNEIEDLYYINGGEEGKIEPRNEILCKVYYRDNKFYTHDGTEEKELEDSFNFKVKEDNTIEITPMYYEPKEEKSSIYFVNCLEDTDLHYDGIECIYVQNVNQDFLKNFLIGTNILIFMLIVIIYVCALIYANKQFHIEYFTSKPVITINIAGITALVLGIILAIILLI